MAWTTDDGRPCYLAFVEAGVARIAAATEASLLRSGRTVLAHARAMRTEPELSTVELRFLVARLYEALHDALTVAELRRARLDVSGDGPAGPSPETAPP
ncbi:hypothetical protein [Streptomyces sp. H27-C3]|uniref:hypothetical protein n=1 Tax=Streptomyces sp. H27-C3 TaxID=3046305 RepID=UPI0024BB6ABB|nr:hypothetical protein [Streptomyces sp. H27-C3]MDJ0460549.1 hypothetical protein [Streptomyces sp. H27-C3]